MVNRRHVFRRLPVFRFGCELITSDDGPFSGVNALIGKKNICDLNADRGDVFHYRILCSLKEIVWEMQVR